MNIHLTFRIGKYVFTLLSGLSKAIKKRLSIFEILRYEIFSDFGEMAIELLQQCHDNDDKELRQLLVAQNSLSRTHSVLGLAELADHEDFIAHADPQRILNEIWSGAIKQEEWMLPKV